MTAAFAILAGAFTIDGRDGAFITAGVLVTGSIFVTDAILVTAGIFVTEAAGAAAPGTFVTALTFVIAAGVFASPATFERTGALPPAVLATRGFATALTIWVGCGCGAARSAGNGSGRRSCNIASSPNRRQSK
mmetsp:Transcript_9688/g.21644  ORF Transcript_9688/g.21644 Transcript_9688/m.21644 type:complete len:133 (-) Transcript_9688:1322-1720(-)